MLRLGYWAGVIVTVLIALALVSLISWLIWEGVGKDALHLRRDRRLLKLTPPAKWTEGRILEMLDALLTDKGVRMLVTALRRDDVPVTGQAWHRLAALSGRDRRLSGPWLSDRTVDEIARLVEERARVAVPATA